MKARLIKHEKTAANIQPFCPKTLHNIHTYINFIFSRIFLEFKSTLENKDLLCKQNKILCSWIKLACFRSSDSGE